MSAQKRKSKARLAAEALIAERRAKAKADALASKGKKKNKRPKRCEVRACRCVAAETLVYKTGSKMHGKVENFFPIHTRSRAAEMQDARYGKGMRLHNPGFAKGKLITWTCTVCGEKTKV